MAQVDFSNAVLDLRTDITPLNPLEQDKYLWLYNNQNFYNRNKGWITNNSNKTIILNTPSKVSILFTGAFTASGTEFYMGGNDTQETSYQLWRVSNISFSSGDIYAFVIDIETSGNT